MTVQTLTLGKQKYVLLAEKDFRRLQKEAQSARADSDSEAAEDRRDAALLRRRLADMRRRGEKPRPYAQVRRELDLE